MTFLTDCFAVYNNKGDLPNASYCVVDFANVMHRFKSFDALIDATADFTMVIVIAKKVKVDGVLYDPAAFVETSIKARLGTTFVVFVTEYARPTKSNIDDILYWFVVACIYLSMTRQGVDPRIDLLTYDTQPIHKDTTFLADSSVKIYELLKSGPRYTPAHTTIVKTIIQQLMHTSRPHKMTRRLVSTLRKSPTHFFGYIKFLQRRLAPA